VRLKPQRSHVDALGESDEHRKSAAQRHGEQERRLDECFHDAEPLLRCRVVRRLPMRFEPDARGKRWRDHIAMRADMRDLAAGEPELYSDRDRDGREEKAGEQSGRHRKRLHRERRSVTENRRLECGMG